METHGTRFCWLALVIAAGTFPLGCSTLSSLTGGVKDATSATKDVQGTAKDATGTAGDASKALKKGEKKEDGGGEGGKAERSDDTRLGATPTKVNVAIDDELSKKDTVDWKKVELLGRAGYATFQANWEDSTAEIKLEVYNDEGVNIATSPKRTGQQAGTKVMAEIPQSGIYFVKISLAGGTATGYTFKCKWSGPSGSAGGESGGGAAAAPAAQSSAAPAAAGAQVPNPAGPAAGGAAATPAAAGAAAPAAGAAAAPTAPGGNAAVGPPLPAATDPNHPRAKILSSYRDEDGSLILFLDRGSASNVRAGQKGQVLLGPDGDVAIAGGEFHISRVVDATKSIGRITHGIANLGAKNNRCIIHLVPWP